MEFRKELLTRIAWRKEQQENRNKDGANLSTRVYYEIELLEDLLITYDNLCVSNHNKQSENNCFISDVSKCGNPWMSIKCEECGRQLLSHLGIGIASFCDKNAEDPWKDNDLTTIKRWVCVSCSDKLGYDYD